MKRIFRLACLLALASPCAGEERGLLGLGAMVGAPIGGSGKYWTSGARAIDAGIGYNGNLAVHGDHLWHGWDLFPHPQGGKLAGYAGLGARLRNREDDDVEFGFRTPAGLAYWPARYPLELFVELAPVFKVNARNALDLDGAVGLRYYFKGGGRAKPKASP